MSNRPQYIAFSLALLLGVSLGGCASFGKCDTAGCVADAKISAEVSALLADHTELGAPGQLRVQTINGVVYLNGLVNTELDRRNAEAIAYQADGVREVVNSIDVQGNGR
jgi:osmotically-inducible protein OsmY